MRKSKSKQILLWVASIFFILSFFVFFPHVSAFLCLLAGIMLLPVPRLQTFFNTLIPQKPIKQILIIALIVVSFLTAPSATTRLPSDSQPQPMATDSLEEERTHFAETANSTEVAAPSADLPDDTPESSTAGSEGEIAPSLGETPGETAAPSGALPGSDSSAETAVQDADTAEIPTDTAPAGSTAGSDVADSVDAAEPGDAVEPVDDAPQAATITYVLNTNTMKFHYESCRDVKKIKAENYSTFTGSRDTLLSQGYTSCGHCNP